MCLSKIESGLELYLNSIGIGKSLVFTRGVRAKLRRTSPAWTAAPRHRLPSHPCTPTRRASMETVRRFTDQTAPTSAASAAQRGAVVRMLPLEPAQQHQSMLAAATAPGPSASRPLLRLTLSPPLSWLDNPGPCVLNMAPDPLSLAMSSDQEVDMEDAEEVEMDNPEEVVAIEEGRFYLLPPPPPERNAGNGEPELLILFPLAPSASEGN